MSYDLKIFFPHGIFPHEEWANVLAFFETEEREPIKSAHYKFEAEWVVMAAARIEWQPKHGSHVLETDPMTEQPGYVDSWPVWIDLRAVSPKNWGSCLPVGTHWVITIDTSGGANAEAVWTQFAIPYYALSLIEGVTAHDCQWHSEDNLYSFQDGDAWTEFASLALERRLRKSKSDLARLGFISEEGKALF